MINKSKQIILTGATSLIGQYLLPVLLNNQFIVQAISRTRTTQSADSASSWHHITDSLDQAEPPLSAAATAIHLAPLWILPDFIPVLAALGVTRLIAFSSTSCFTKQASQHPYEQQVVLNLLDAEQKIKALCAHYKICWTIFRPTLIYGDIDDNKGLGKGLATIANFIKRCYFFPIVGAGQGLRQPVHAADLAAACLAVIDANAAFNQAYNLSGAEILNYRQMVERIFLKLKLMPRFIALPLPLIKLSLNLLRLLPKYRFLTAEMANRMNQDMVFAHDAAVADFNYTPRRFLCHLVQTSKRPS